MKNIRYATIEDSNIILDFITKLAIYEKLEHEVFATKESIEQTIFIDKKAEVLFVLEDNKEVGFALFFTSYSTFLAKPGIFLEDLFVLEEYRGKGYGKSLIVKLKNVAIERKYGRLEWNCLKWNQPSIEFYENLNATKLDEWIGFRLDKENLK